MSLSMSPGIPLRRASSLPVKASWHLNVYAEHPTTSIRFDRVPTRRISTMSGSNINTATIGARCDGISNPAKLVARMSNAKGRRGPAFHTSSKRVSVFRDHPTWPSAPIRAVVASRSPSATFPRRSRLQVPCSQAHRSSKFTEQAAKRATASAKCSLPPVFVSVVSMPETSGDSGKRVSHDIF